MLRRISRAVGVLAGVVCAACAGPAPDAPPPGVDKPLTFSILEDYDKGADLDAVAKDFDVFHELGITTWRGSFGWDDYEPARGRYDFAWLERFADLAAARGITLRPYLAYTPAWAGGGGADTDVWNDPPRRMNDWSRFAGALATTMAAHPSVASYEIYNEENTRQWWDGSPAAYTDVLQRASRAIRAVDRDAQVLLGGLVFADSDWIAHVCAGGGGAAIDVVPLHAYPETWTPADVTVETYLGPSFDTGFAADVDDSCGHKPIWMNEIGFATVAGKTERDQAVWWIRAVATFAADPRVEHIGVYEIRDLAPGAEAIGGAPNYHLGLLHADGRRKMAFGTVQRLASLLGGGRVRAIDAAARVTATSGAAGGVFHHAFLRPDGTQIVIAWTRGKPATIDVALPAPASSAVEYGIDGAERGARRLRRATIAGITLAPGEPRIFATRR